MITSAIQVFLAVKKLLLGHKNVEKATFVTKIVIMVLQSSS
jgi:hypothetical protein